MTIHSRDKNCHTFVWSWNIDCHCNRATIQILFLVVNFIATTEIDAPYWPLHDSRSQNSIWRPSRAWTWGSHWRRSATNQRAQATQRRFIDIPHSPRIIKADKKEEGIVCLAAISRRGFVTPPALPISYSPSHLPLRWLNRVRSKGVHACCCCLARCTCPPTHPFISLGRRSCSCCGLHPIVLKARPSTNFDIVA